LPSDPLELTIARHKFHGAKMAYLLQPCHVLPLLLLFIVQLPRGSPLGAVLLSVYLHSLSGPLLGTVGVDLSCYTQLLEAVNWGVQHVSLLVVPLHLLASRFGGRNHSGLAVCTLSFAAMVLFRFAALMISGAHFDRHRRQPQLHAVPAAGSRRDRADGKIRPRAHADLLRGGRLRAALHLHRGVPRRVRQRPPR